jgi:predicted peptidase
MSPAGYQQFALHFGTPYPNNINRYGARGYSNGHQIFPNKGVNMGDQTNDNVNDIAVISSASSLTGNGYVLMLYGQDIPTDVEILKEQPEDFYLNQNYPNPFNPSTTIKYDIAKSGKVELVIFDMLGKKIKTVVNEFQNPGNYNAVFDASRFASGVYLYQLKVNDYVDTKKMILLK